MNTISSSNFDFYGSKFYPEMIIKDDTPLLSVTTLVFGPKGIFTDGILTKCEAGFVPSNGNRYNSPCWNICALIIFLIATNLLPFATKKMNIGFR